MNYEREYISKLILKDLEADEIEERSMKLGKIKTELEDQTEAWMELAEKAEG